VGALHRINGLAVKTFQLRGLRLLRISFLAHARQYTTGFGIIARSPEKGAETSIYLASSPEVQSITGKYFVDCKAAQPAPQATDSAVAKKLWDISAEMVHLADGLPAKT
jgi:hypothetical protein